MKIHTSFSSLTTLKHPVITIGTFDGVHLGHRSIIDRLNKIKEATGGESVLLTFYPHPRMVLHPEDHNVQLLNSPEEKSALLAEAGVDHLVVYPFSQEFSRMSPYEYVRDLLVTGLKAHTVVVGYDHRFGRNREGNHETLLELSETFGFRVQEIPPRVIDDINISSTKIRTALKSGQIKEAASFLGYNYSITGTVVHGDGIGRTLGYPTANISPDYALKLIPAHGIYAVRVKVNEEKFNGVMSIGVRPTVTQEKKETIEAFILDYDENIYGQKITVEFLDYIREEKKFGSIDELKANIAQDIETSLPLF